MASHRYLYQIVFNTLSSHTVGHVHTPLIHPGWIRSDTTLSSSRHDKQAWMSRHNGAQTTPTHASGFHLFTVAMTGHAKDKGVQLPQQVTNMSFCPNAVKESRSERVGSYRNEQGGFACLALLKIALSLHQCQRSHHRYHVYREGTNTGNTEGNTINAMHNMMHDHDMAKWMCFGLMQLATD